MKKLTWFIIILFIYIFACINYSKHPVIVEGTEHVTKPSQVLTEKVRVVSIDSPEPSTKLTKEENIRLWQERIDRNYIAVQATYNSVMSTNVKEEIKPVVRPIQKVEHRVVNNYYYYESQPYHVDTRVYRDSTGHITTTQTYVED